MLYQMFEIHILIILNFGQSEPKNCKLKIKLFEKTCKCQYKNENLANIKAIDQSKA